MRGKGSLRKHLLRTDWANGYRGQIGNCCRTCCCIIIKHWDEAAKN